MDNKKIDNEIKKIWFKNHTATVSEQGTMTVLDWKNPESGCYYTRYVFDGRHIYITGDIGYAVFNLTWQGSPYADWNNTYLGYFLEKLEAFSDERYEWNENLALKAIKKWYKELKEDEVSVDKERYYDLLDDLQTCENKNDWVYLVNNTYNEFIRDLDFDYWEWIFDIGDETPARLRAYLIGLKMASEQLKKNKVSA